MLANLAGIMAEIKMANAYTSPGRIVSRYCAITGERPDGRTMSEMFRDVVAAELGDDGRVPIDDFMDDMLSQLATE